MCVCLLLTTSSNSRPYSKHNSWNSSSPVLTSHYDDELMTNYYLNDWFNRTLSIVTYCTLFREPWTKHLDSLRWLACLNNVYKRSPLQSCVCVCQDKSNLGQQLKEDSNLVCPDTMCVMLNASLFSFSHLPRWTNIRHTHKQRVFIHIVSMVTVNAHSYASSFKL